MASVDIPEALRHAAETATRALNDVRLTAYQAFLAQVTYHVRRQWPTATHILIDATAYKPDDPCDSDGARLLSVRVGGRWHQVRDICEDTGLDMHTARQIDQRCAAIDLAATLALDTGITAGWAGSALTEFEENGTVQDGLVLTMTLSPQP